MNRLCFGISILSLTSLLVNGDDNRKPFSPIEPTSGHYVETDAGFMMPYKTRIPGTNIEFEMVPVPATSETKPFWIGKYEVTLKEYEEFAKLDQVFRQTAHLKKKQNIENQRIDFVSAPTAIYDPSSRFEGVESSECPAYSMTLYSAKQYTKWLSLISSIPYRLPTETEWEHACSAGGSGHLFDKEKARQFAVFDSETENVVKVGSRQPNAWGIHDLQGNASEWVITQLPQRSSKSKKEASERVALTSAPIWISKGGNFASALEDCYPERRFVVTSEEWDSDPDYPKSTTWLANFSQRDRIGFRIVRPLGDLSKESMADFWDAETPHYQSEIDTKIDEGRVSEGVVDSNTPNISQGLKTRDQGWIRKPR